MKGKKIREFLQQTAVKTGAVIVATALVLTSSTWSGSLRPDTITEASLPIFIDTEGDERIEGEEVPLAGTFGSPKVTKTTKTKVSTKKVRMRVKSAKTYVKKSATKTTTKTAKKTTSTAKTTTKTVTATNVTNTFIRGSNIYTQKTTVKTTVTTTVESKAKAGTASSSVVTLDAGSAGGVQPAEQVQKLAKTGLGIRSMAPRADARALSAFEQLGFTVNVNPTVSYAGVFDARAQAITLKDENDTIYHELGHFVAFVAGNVDTSMAFQQIYQQEMNAYTEFNRSYVTQNSSEYFAESFKNYTLEPAKLRSTRPQTYMAIEQALSNITDAQVSRMASVYGPLWK